MRTSLLSYCNSVCQSQKRLESIDSISKVICSCPAPLMYYGLTRNCFYSTCTLFFPLSFTQITWSQCFAVLLHSLWFKSLWSSLAVMNKDRSLCKGFYISSDTGHQLVHFILPFWLIAIPRVTQDNSTLIKRPAQSTNYPFYSIHFQIKQEALIPTEPQCLSTGNISHSRSLRRCHIGNLYFHREEWVQISPEGLCLCFSFIMCFLVAPSSEIYTAFFLNKHSVKKYGYNSTSSIMLRMCWLIWLSTSVVRVSNYHKL